MAKQTKADLETEVMELRQRVEKLEALLAASSSKVAPSVTAATKPTVHGEIAPDIVLAITAAVAAFLGKRATIHQIRLTGTTAWAMQGRATVQASHGLVRWSR
jgi:methylmalonyl-CoA carboxyltransferase large subunit